MFFCQFTDIAIIVLTVLFVCQESYPATMVCFIFTFTFVTTLLLQAIIIVVVVMVTFLLNDTILGTFAAKS